MRRLATSLAGAVALVAALGCGGGPAPEPASGPRSTGEDAGGPATTEALVDSLRAAGIPVKAIGVSNPVWFSPKGAFFGMAGQYVQVFEYEDAAEARADAGKVAAGGDSVAGSSVAGSNMPHGKGPTRFYRRGPLIVLLDGDDATLRHALERLLGPPIAGPGAGE